MTDTHNIKKNNTDNYQHKQRIIVIMRRRIMIKKVRRKSNTKLEEEEDLGKGQAVCVDSILRKLVVPRLDGASLFYHFLAAYNDEHLPHPVYYDKIARVDSQICRTLDIRSKMTQRLFCLNGKIVPNLVTLVETDRSSTTA